MPYFTYINGKILPYEKTFVHISDLGLLRAYGVFDYMRTYNGKPFLPEKHLARFENSARELNLRLPLSKKEITRIIHQLLKKSKPARDVGIRLLLTGGRSADGITISRPTFAIVIEKLVPVPEKLYTTGAKLITHDYQRETPLVKTTNYKNAIKKNADKLRAKAHEILYCSQGKILETTRNNFFAFKGNTLITAKENVLHGITRDFVLALAQGSFNVEERNLRLTELEELSEAFITGTTRRILPVIQIDNTRIGTGKPGKNSLFLLKLFDEQVAAH